MTCKIERFASGDSKVVLRVCGRIQVEHAGTIEELIGDKCQGVILDLTEVMLVDRDVVSFLAACERKGVELRNCPAFLQEWIAKEQLHPAADFPD
jgi:anti-anti-sigma regulatory factor